MLPLQPRDLRTLALAAAAGALFVFAFVFGLAHLARTPRTTASWHANGQPAERVTRDLVGRAGLCLYWDAFGRLDASASGVFGEFGRQRELDAQELARFSDRGTRAELDLASLAAAIAAATEPGTCGPATLHELVRPGWFAKGFEGAHVIPCDPWGRGYRFAAETDRHAARVWTFGRDGRPGGVGEDEDVVCEFSGRGEPCFWHGTLATDER